MCYEGEPVAVDPKNGCVKSVAQPGCALGNRVEHRLDIGRRAGDHPQDLTRRGLSIQRLCQITITRLKLLEQADVLDGNDRLVGKGLEQADLSLTERAAFQSADMNDADRDALTEQGCGKRSAHLFGHPSIRELIQRRLNVVDVDRPPIQHYTTDVPRSGYWSCLGGRDRSALRTQPQELGFD